MRTKGPHIKAITCAVKRFSGLAPAGLWLGAAAIFGWLGLSDSGEAQAMFYVTNQVSVMCKDCPIGSQEAEEIFQRARKYKAGAAGFPRDRVKAKELAIKATEMGNSKAPLLLGQLYMYDFSLDLGPKRFKPMLKAYEQSAKMGCPDAYFFLYQAYAEGWGVSQNHKKALELIKKGADLGSPKALEVYGTELANDPRMPGWLITHDKAKLNEAKKYLYRSLELGNGDAGYILYAISKRESDSAGMINHLRYGAKLGSRACLDQLYSIYIYGDFGQPKDTAQAMCFKHLRDGINIFDTPKVIPSLDKICPMKQPRPFIQKLGGNKRN